jgi:hypothetical protein
MGALQLPRVAGKAVQSALRIAEQTGLQQTGCLRLTCLRVWWPACLCCHLHTAPTLAPHTCAPPAHAQAPRHTHTHTYTNLYTHMYTLQPHTRALSLHTTTRTRAHARARAHTHARTHTFCMCSNRPLQVFKTYSEAVCALTPAQLLKKYGVADDLAPCETLARVPLNDRVALRDRVGGRRRARLSCVCAWHFKPRGCHTGSTGRQGSQVLRARVLQADKRQPRRLGQSIHVCIAPQVSHLAFSRPISLYCRAVCGHELPVHGACQGAEAAR